MGQQMTAILLSPPLAFVAYALLASILASVGRLLAGPGRATPLKTDVYASGEAPPLRPAVPGYRPFFAIALFFAVLHLGVLMLGSGPLSPIVGIYVIGLLLALVALILG
jgi:NADH:ubiquinone oxidoreductase subunit 3 (subunit A)